MMTDDLAQEDSRICPFNVGLVCAHRFGLRQLEPVGSSTAERSAGRIPCRVSGCHARAILFGIIRAARGC